MSDFENVFGVDSLMMPDELEYSDAKIYLQRILKLCEDTIAITVRYCKNPPEIKVAFLTSLTLNAEVRKFGDAYYIGINVGTILILQDMFGKMLAQRSVLAELGDSSLESEKKQIISISQIDREVTYDLEPQEPDGIKCLERRKYAGFLFDFVIRFLVIHECGHVLKGHIDTFKTAQKFIREINPNEEIHALDMQTLEMDADSLATNTCLVYLKALAKQGGPWSSFNPPIKNLKDGIFFWSFAIYSMFRLFRFEKKSVKDYLRAGHPHLQ